MTHRKKIFAIKFAHSAIFLFMTSCLAYILYCTIARRYDWILLAALGAIFLEVLAVLLNRQCCPLTSLAEKYGAANGAVTNIFLPKWLARHILKIGTVLIIVGLIWLATGYFIS